MSKVGDTNVLAWEAHTVADTLVCLADANDKGFSVSAYCGADGIEGVAVYDADGCLLEAVGKFPAALLKELTSE